MVSDEGAMTPESARQLLADWRVVELNELETSRNIAWTMVLVDSSKKQCVTVENSGRGGCNSYHSADPVNVRRLRAAAGIISEGDTEALDTVTAYALKGETLATGALRAWEKK